MVIDPFQKMLFKFFDFDFEMKIFTFQLKSSHDRQVYYCYDLSIKCFNLSVFCILESSSYQIYIRAYSPARFTGAKIILSHCWTFSLQTLSALRIEDILKQDCMRLWDCPYITFLFVFLALYLFCVLCFSVALSGCFLGRWFFW